MISFYLPQEVYDFFQVRGDDGWMYFESSIKPEIQEHITQFGGETNHVWTDQNDRPHLIINRPLTSDGTVLDSAPIVMFADESNAVAFKLVVANYNVQLEIVKFDDDDNNKS